VTSPHTEHLPFGSVLADTMAIACYREASWTAHKLRKTAPVDLHPAAHAFHYGSSCFEGFKAYRWRDGSVYVFRMDQHIRRLCRSAQALYLPIPDPARIARMIVELVDRVRAQVPELPGALYLRPILFGTMQNIGAVSVPCSEACLIVLASPVWEYFSASKSLRIFVDEKHSRSAPHLGSVKTGGNYAAALGPTLIAQQRFGADQVLFSPGGEVQETGVANFLLVRAGRLLTRVCDSTILHGVTRDSVLTLARDSGYDVEERVFDVAEMLHSTREGEAALCGTGAVLAGVGMLIHNGCEYPVSSGEIGPHTRRLREALVAIQQGDAPDRHRWLTRVAPQSSID
jgi:branched-chain amino acid aminotransferase